jgi:hypothetical protein
VYTISDPVLLVNLPTYSWFPTQSHTLFSYAVVSGQTFVTIGGSPAKIQIQTSIASNTGTYTITIRTTETNSGLTNDQSFTLLVKCVKSIAASSLTDVLYFMSDAAITRTPVFTLTPADCPYELVLTVT